MKRRHFKFMSLLLAGVLTFTLVACNNDGGTTDPDDDTGVSDDDGDDGTGDDGTGEVLEFTLMGSNWGDHEKSLENGTSAIFDKLMEDTNTKINFEWLPADNYANVVTQTLAGGDIPEVINGAGTNLINEGAAVALDGLMEEHAPNVWATVADNPIEETKLRNAEDGNLYLIPFALDFPPAYAWSIRADWLDQVGLEMPETWDDWLEVWEAFKTNDLNGDGDASNELPYSGDIFSLMPIFGMNVSNRNSIMIDENNNWTLAPESPHFRTYLEAVREMYNNGYLDPEFADRGVYVENNNLTDAIMSGLVGSTFTWAEITRTATLALSEVEGQEDAKLVGITPPTGPDGHSGIPGRNAITATSVITISAEERGVVNDILGFFNHVFSDEGVVTMSYGIEGVHHDVVDGVPVLKEEFGTSFADARQAGLNFTPFAHKFDAAAYESIMLGGNTYEESDPATQQFVDALYMGEGHWFSSVPGLNTEAYAEYAAELLPQLATAISLTVIGDMTIDEFYNEYENLKSSGLQEIMDQGNDAWQTLTGGE